MAYTAKVLDVMMASPSDVSKERQIVRNVIGDWNAVHAKDRKTVLMPVGWETHSIPDTGDRPQAIINGQLLKDADLLIAVFWTRIGSPTGAAPSGTVEEIEEHIGAGKSAMIYFSSAPVHPDSIDNEQYTALKEFKQSIKARGLYEEYESLSQFQWKLTRQLAQMIISRFPSDNASSATSLPPIGTPAPLLIPEMNAESQDLLLEASKDPQGVVMSLSMMDGDNVQTNGRQFVERGDARSAALWRGAVAQLEGLRLIEDRRGRGEVFFVTDEGYRVAELLKRA